MKKNILILSICIICFATIVAVSLRQPADGRKEGDFHFEKLLSGSFLTGESKMNKINFNTNLNNTQQN